MVHVCRSCERATFVETQTREVVRIILSLFKHVRIVCRARGSLVRFVFNALLNGVTIVEGNNRQKIHVLHARGRGIGVRIEKNKTTGEHAFPHKCIRTWHASQRWCAIYRNAARSWPFFFHLARSRYVETQRKFEEPRGFWLVVDRIDNSCFVIVLVWIWRGCTVHSLYHCVESFWQDVGQRIKGFLEPMIFDRSVYTGDVFV